MRFKFFMFFLLLSLACLKTASAGPPFLNDDPEPVEFKHWEAYLFSTHDAKRHSIDALGPAFEFNVGAAPNLQLHLIVPLAYSLPDSGPRTFGLGDIEVGFKFRFIQEGKEGSWRPQVGIFPLLEIPTGDADRGLGNGRVWTKLPLLFQKSWEPWTTYGGFGYVINPAGGQRNHFYGGWLVQREMTEWLTLGGEAFAQEKDTDDGSHTVILNFGGIIKITPAFNLLFSVGHSIAGQDHLVGYFGLYWTGGFGGEGKQTKLSPKLSGVSYGSMR